MATVTAIRAFYARLCDIGKPRQMTLVAAMRKLLIVLNTVMHDQVL